MSMEGTDLQRMLDEVELGASKLDLGEIIRDGSRVRGVVGLPGSSVAQRWRRWWWP